MIKILFLIHDLGHGGAEKVLVNLVNHLDKTIFSVSVIALFGGGVNEQFLDADIRFKVVFPKNFRGNVHIMKLFTPEQLHKYCVKDIYDIEVSYLEGPSARIVSGCQNPNTKLVSWIHVEQHSAKKAAHSFRSVNEASDCYNRFHETICVSDYVRKDFCEIFELKNPCSVLFNTVESEKILRLSTESVSQIVRSNEQEVLMIAVGSLKPSKGFTRLLRIINEFKKKKYHIKLYILGEGPERGRIEKYIKDNNLRKQVVLLGYQINPYKYVAKCDLFVCASYAEGFSTAVTEALIVGTPVCTVDVSGMKELLGDNNEYGIVTENDEYALYRGIKSLLDNTDRLSYYANQAKLRGCEFNTDNTVKAVEQMLKRLKD